MGDDTHSRGSRDDRGGRGGSGAAGPPVDPLTELARLIGQSDPFATDGQRRASARPAEPQPADWPDPRYVARPSEHDAPPARDFPPEHGGQAHAYDDGYGGPAYQDQPYDSDPGSADQPGDDQAYDAYGSYARDDHEGQPDDAGRFYDEEAPVQRRRGWLVAAAALAGLAVIGTAGAFAYRAVFTSGPPSIIARAPGPNKVTPAAELDSRTNKRLDRIASGGSDERMVSREEQPIMLPDTQSAPSAGPGGSVSMPPMPAKPSAPADIAAPPPAAPANAAAPRKIRTVTIKSDAPPADAPAPVAAQPAPHPAAPPRAAQSAPAVQNGPLSLTPQSVVQPPAPSLRTSAVATPPAAAQGGESGYFVQVTAQKSEAEAQSSFQGIQAKYANLLGAHQPVIRRKDLGSKGIFYGAQVGPLSHEAAVKLCESLKAAGGPCMIQKN